MNKKQFFFTVFCLLCSFLISAEYAIIRSASSSLFIQEYGAQLFPLAWLITIPFNLILTSAYNRYLPKIGSMKMFFSICLISSAINMFSSHYINKIPHLSFIQYIWKDVYILFMFKQLWSLVHTTIDNKKGKFLYGFIFAFGGIGSILAGLFVKKFSTVLTTPLLLSVTFPIYIFLACFYYIATKNSCLSNQNIFSTFSTKIDFKVFRLKPLMYLLIFVVFMQLSVSFSEYQFNIYLEQSMPSLDLRTEYLGKMVSLVNFFSLLLQMISGVVFIQLFGEKRMHFLLPLFLLLNSCFLLFAPSFIFAAYSFISIKSVDFSIFCILREMLYNPLPLEKKFNIKAFIDVFVYRSAKGIGSIFLLLIPTGLSFLKRSHYISLISLIIFIAWFFLAYYFISFKKKALIND